MTMSERRYVFNVATTFVNDKKGGWSAECIASRSDTLVVTESIKVTGQSTEVNAIKQVIGKAHAALNKEARRATGKEGQSQ